MAYGYVCQQNRYDYIASQAGIRWRRGACSIINILERPCFIQLSNLQLPNRVIRRVGTGSFRYEIDPRMYIYANI